MSQPCEPGHLEAVRPADQPLIVGAEARLSYDLSYVSAAT